MKNKIKKQKTRSRNSLLIIPPPNIKNKYSSESDIIVNSLINKIISLTISTSIKNRIEKEISDKCFNYIHEFLKNKLLIEFLPHDNDDSQNSKNPNELSIYSNKFWPVNSSFDENSYIITKSKEYDDYNSSLINNIHQIFYSNNSPGENDWDIMEEPKSNKYDSYSSTMVKFIELERQEIQINKKNNKKDINVNVNALEEVKEESLSKSYLDNKDKENDENKINNNIDKNEDSKKNEITKKITKRINISIPNNQVKRKRNDIDINQFPFQDIENDNNYNYENNDEIDYEKLRKELHELEEAKLKEQSNKNKKTNKTLDIKQIIGENNNKQYYGKNITVDPNGQIVLIKYFGLNKLKQEFKYPKTVLKNVKQPKKKLKKKEIIENNDEQQIDKENNKENNKDNNKENNKENIIRKDNDIKSNDINSLKDNNNLDEKKNSDSKILPKISQKNMNLPLKTENNEQKKIKREPVFPSGSNFNLMNLEIGVSLKEDEKYKTGGKDFFKKFTKYSKDIFNEKLQESIAANSLLKTTTPVFMDDSNKFKTESNFENTYGGFNINQQDNSIQKDINSKYLMTSSNNFGGYNYLSNISNLIGSNNNNLMTKTISQRMNQSNTLNPSIQLSNISSLIGSLDKLNLITDNQEKLGKKNQNFFKNYKKKKLKGLLLNKFNEMDEFAKGILKTGDLSNRGGQSQGKSLYIHKNPGKPSILEITRELGYKVRPTRNRSKITSSVINPALKTVAFFKQ